MILRSRNVPRTSRRHVSSGKVASLRYAGPVVDELKQLIYHSGSLLLVGSTQVALVDHPKWYAVSAAPLSAAYTLNHGESAVSANHGEIGASTSASGQDLAHVTQTAFDGSKRAARASQTRRRLDTKVIPVSYAKRRTNLKIMFQRICPHLPRSIWS